MRNRRAPLSAPTGTRLQYLLDEGDSTWFARNPGKRERHRFYFRGERVEDGAPNRYVVVTQEDGRLVRRFTSEGTTV